ncbi:glycoside hydrolase family 3 protein [bacterium]|nr:glycoside hydrolase family 3 protein [bacterium]
MPGNMALASTKDPKYTYDAAKVMAKELKLLGININFAPVVDINSNPANPVIGIRSFSDNPDVVLAHAKEYMKGLHSE